ncbi:hypothetical protein ACFLUO_08580 [Chloroflexota bacterium]
MVIATSAVLIPNGVKHEAKAAGREPATSLMTFLPPINDSTIPSAENEY